VDSPEVDVSAFTAAIRRACGWPSFPEQRVRCPYCGATPFKPCYVYGRPDLKLVRSCHPARLEHLRMEYPERLP
jgi:hypothetical protein